MKTLHVGIKDHPYDLFIDEGLITRLGDVIKHEGQAVIVTDTGVPIEYIKAAKESLNTPHVFTFNQGESNKTIETVAALIAKLQAALITRSDFIVAVGGGIVGDVAGFVASIYLRGIDFYNVPTTLLSQIDSSVGGKVGVNSPVSKNAIGAFKQPRGVFIDPTVLNTLEERQFNSGVAELIKHALIKDADLFHDLETKPFSKNIIDFILRSVSIKRDIVVKDVYDQNERQLLNFGHTIAHGLEKISKHDLLHGEAVAIGMSYMSKDLPEYERVVALLKKFSLPTETPFSYEQLKSVMSLDKKTKKDSITLVLLESLGKAVLSTGSLNDLKPYLK
jgi:3-dehydroquinate synthase